MRLRRVYYSAFSPIPEASVFAGRQTAASAARESAVSGGLVAALLRLHRSAEIAAGGAGWHAGSGHRSQAGLGAETSRPLPGGCECRRRARLLLRVPGLGARVVDRIVETRRHTRLRLADVARLSPGMKRARPFLIAADHSPGASDGPCRSAGPADRAPPDEPVRMRSVPLAPGADLEGFRAALRALIAEDVPPRRDVPGTTRRRCSGPTPMTAAPPIVAAAAGGGIDPLGDLSQAIRSGMRCSIGWSGGCVMERRALLEIASDPLGPSPAPHGKIHPPRCAQDACLCPFPACGNRRTAIISSPGSSPSISSWKWRRTFFIERFHVHALVDPDADRRAALGPRSPDPGAARAPGGCAGERRLREGLAHLL